MARGDFLGDFELLVVLAVIRLGERAYGLPVRDEIGERTGRAVSTGAVYATLDRLERKGLLESHVESGGIERDQRRRRFYVPTDAAHAAVAETRSAIAAMARGLRLRTTR